MTVLGEGGLLRLRRERPSAVTVTASANDIDPGTSSLLVADERIWDGDEVTLTAARGLPFNISDMGIPNGLSLPIPDCPDGYNMYAGGPWLPSSVRSHVQFDDSRFYRNDNAVPFYVTPEGVGLTTTVTYFAYKDQLDRVSFYTTRAAALRGAQEDRIPLFRVDFGQLSLQVVIRNRDWRFQGKLVEWQLDLSASEVDTTALGDRFGDAVKSLVTGGGSLNFLIDRTDLQNEHDGTFLLNLLLIVQRGSEAEAEFWMIPDRDPAADFLLPGRLYYQANILITAQALNTRASEIIAGSVNFVTVREIGLRMGTT
jgi:hypothetical protein